jgi:hypothetical protein
MDTTPWVVLHTRIRSYCSEAVEDLVRVTVGGAFPGLNILCDRIHLLVLDTRLLLDVEALIYKIRDASENYALKRKIQDVGKIWQDSLLAVCNALP